MKGKAGMASAYNAHLTYRPFTELPSLRGTIAANSCDNAPNEKGIRWNRLMYW